MESKVAAMFKEEAGDVAIDPAILQRVAKRTAESLPQQSESRKKKAKGNKKKKDPPVDQSASSAASAPSGDGAGLDGLAAAASSVPPIPTETEMPPLETAMPATVTEFMAGTEVGRQLAEFDAQQREKDEEEKKREEEQEQEEAHALVLAEAEAVAEGEEMEGAPEVEAEEEDGEEDDSTVDPDHPEDGEYVEEEEEEEEGKEDSSHQPSDAGEKEKKKEEGEYADEEITGCPIDHDDFEQYVQQANKTYFSEKYLETHKQAVKYCCHCLESFSSMRINDNTPAWCCPKAYHTYDECVHAYCSKCYWKLRNDPEAKEDHEDVAKQRVSRRQRNRRKRS